MPPSTAAARRAVPWPAVAVWLAGAAPLAKMVVDGIAGGLGANPVEAILNRLGFWSLTWLALALVPTPASEWLGLGWAIRARRAAGLVAFAWASLHLAFYVGVDRFLDLRTLAADLARRPFIGVGFAAWLILLALAVTSRPGWVRRLGYRRWKRLHRLVYLAAALGVVHFLWRVKADRTRPLLFALVFAVLLALRIPGWVRAARRDPPPAPSR